jgi:hypothetical protein
MWGDGHNYDGRDDRIKRVYSSLKTEIVAPRAPDTHSDSGFSLLEDSEPARRFEGIDVDGNTGWGDIRLPVRADRAKWVQLGVVRIHGSFSSLDKLTISLE